MSLKLDNEKLEIWAGYLLDHSLGGVKPGERVMIKGENVAWPLLEILERRVVKAGGIPDLLLVPPNNERGRVWSATMGRSMIWENPSVPPWLTAANL